MDKSLPELRAALLRHQRELLEYQSYAPPGRGDSHEAEVSAWLNDLTAAIVRMIDLQIAQRGSRRRHGDKPAIAKSTSDRPVWRLFGNLFL